MALQYRFVNFVLLLLCSCFIIPSEGEENHQRDLNPDSKSYDDILHDASLKVRRHRQSSHDSKTSEMAAMFADAVYDVLEPIRRRIREDRRKRVLASSVDEHGRSDDINNNIIMFGGGSADGNDNNDADNGNELLLQKILDRIESLYNGEEEGDSNSDSNTTSKCIRDTGRLIVGLMSSQPWAIPFLDSTGKPGPALMKQHLNFVGDYDECRAATAPAVRSNTTTGGEIVQEEGFDGNYCVVGAYVGIPFTTAQVGVCMPSTCSSLEVTNLMNQLVNLTSFKVRIGAECRAAKTEVTTATIFSIIILATSGILMLIGTIYDLFWVSSETTKELPISSKSDQNMHQNANSPIQDEKKERHRSNDEAAPLLIPPSSNKTSKSSSPSVLGKVLLAFSVYTNGRKILNTTQASGSLGAIHGIRFLSMSWVVLCHFYLNLIQGLNGLEAFSNWLDRWTFLPIANGFVCVDTFFTLSGLLTSYLTIKEMARKKSWNVNWPMFYFHRFWRLTPPYMFSLVIVLGLSQYLGEGPLWQNQQPSDKTFCEKNWWTNLLYVNNLVNSKEGCFGHSWYLANDMQFFILSPLMIIPFYFSRLAGMLSCFGFLLITSITTGALSTEKDWPATSISLKNVHSGAQSWGVDYYNKPWCRIGPFVVGVIAGYVLAHTKGKPFRIPRFLVISGWTMAFAAGLAVVYGLRGDVSGDDPSSTSVSAFYNAVARTVWGACVSWVIVACAAGYGGPIHTLLSWSPFVLLGRLTYMAYLVHICILSAFFGNLGALPYTNDTTAVILYLGLLLFVNMASFVLVLALEAPMVGLERAFLRRR